MKNRTCILTVLKGINDELFITAKHIHVHEVVDKTYTSEQLSIANLFFSFSIL